MRTPLVALLVLATLVPVATLAPAAPAPVTVPGAGSFHFELVGHDPLFARGMNAAPAIYDHYVYVGSRTDAQPEHPHPGVLVVDVADPADPVVVGEIGAPHEGLLGMTSRELRVWPEQGLLIVMNFGCSSLIHACTGDAVTAERPNFKFFDVRADPVDPPLVRAWAVVDAAGARRTPHEMFLWVDPARPAERALMYVTTPSGPPGLVVADISGVRGPTGVQVLADWDAQRDAGLDEPRGNPLDHRTEEGRAILHSLGLTPDGRVAHLAHQGAGYLAVNTSDFADGVAQPQVRLVTPIENRVDYSPPLPPEVHSAVKVPGEPLVLLTDEVYPLVPGLISDGGCPFGWAHFVDVRDPTRPVIVGEYRIPQNEPSFCTTAEGVRPRTSYTSHNPTLVRDVAFVTWHAGGLQAFRTNPNAPTQVGAFFPEPLPSVATEDPALGGHPVTMWSYPIIRDGLLYVVDLRNGLYVLRYTGPGAEDLADVAFLEGNSNLGDAARLEAGL